MIKLLRFLAIGILFTLYNLGCTGKSSLSNKVVLDVNGDRWTAEDFSKELVFRFRNEDALNVKDPTKLNQAKNQIVDDFIVQSLSAQWIRKRGLILKAEVIQGEIEKVRKSYPDNLSFQKALAEQGINFKDWRERLEKTLSQQLVVEELSKSVAAPTPTQVQTYFNQNRERFARREQVFVRHIMLPIERDAKLIESELKKGSSIAKIVDVLNKSTEFPAIKADEFWVDKGESSIFLPAFKMPLGARSPVIKSEFGFHIFELLKKKPSQAANLREATPQIQRDLLEKGQQEAYAKWLDEELRNSRIFKNVDFINDLKIETRAY